MITIAETEPFQRKSGSLLSQEEKEDLIAYLAEHPNAGNIIQATNGVRKLRWARGNRGKVQALELFTTITAKSCHYIYSLYSVRMRK